MRAPSRFFCPPMFMLLVRKKKAVCIYEDRRNPRCSLTSVFGNLSCRASRSTLDAVSLFTLIYRQCRSFSRRCVLSILLSWSIMIDTINHSIIHTLFVRIIDAFRPIHIHSTFAHSVATYHLPVRH